MERTRRGDQDSESGISIQASSLSLPFYISQHSIMRQSDHLPSAALPLATPPTLSSINPHYLFHFFIIIPRRWRRCHMWNMRRESTFENSWGGRQQKRAVSDTSSWQLRPPRGEKKTCAPSGGLAWMKFAGCFVIQTRGAMALSKKSQDDEIWMALRTKEWNFVVRWSGEFPGRVSQKMLLPLNVKFSFHAVINFISKSVSSVPILRH